MAKKKSKLILKNPLDFTLLITVFILLGLGIITVLSASSPTALAETGNSYKYLIKQMEAAVIGIFLMFVASKIDYKLWQKNYKIIYCICMILLLAVCALGREAGGAKRWLDMGFLSFQPSEVAKVGVIIFYSAWLTKNKEKLKTFKYGFVYPLLWLLIPIFFILILQNHFSATLVICMLAAILMILAGCKIRYFIFVGIPLAALGIFAIIVAGQGFRMQRILTFFDPWQDIKGKGWQIVQSLYAIGSGGLFGVGLGESKQKYLYIPEPHNDFIFAVLAEELGFIGCAIVIILFAILIWRGITIAMKAPDMFGSLVAIGITALVVLCMNSFAKHAGIAKLKYGEDTMATVAGKAIKTDTIYQKAKRTQGLELLINQVDQEILDSMYTLTDEEKEEAKEEAESYIEYYKQSGATEDAIFANSGCANYDEFIKYVEGNVKSKKYLYDYLEKKLEDILTKISGVGKVQVLVTYSESSSVVAMRNETRSTSKTEENDSAGGTRKVELIDENKEIVDSDNNPITEKITMPKLEGAIILAEGGDNATIKANIVQAVSAVTGLATHKIQVFKMSK